MAGELTVRGGGALKKAAKKGALKKAAKKGALKKAAAKKSPGKKAAGKKAAGKKSATHHAGGGVQARAFHHMQRAVALISLLEGKTGGDLRMLVDEGTRAYGEGAWYGAVGMLRAAEHLGMAGLYAARASHRVVVEEPAPDAVLERLDRVASRLDHFAGDETSGRLYAVATELVKRAEAAADHDLHLAWELVGAADGICDALDGTRV